MKEAMIIDAVRTPIGKIRGALSSVRPDDLAAQALRVLLARNPNIPQEKMEDIWLGCVNQAGEDNRNVARMALLLAGLPITTAGCTVNRLCGSGLEAVNQAAGAIALGHLPIAIAGGVESMSRAPLVMLKPEVGLVSGNQMLVDTTLGWRFVNPRLAEMYSPISMGETAEEVADRYAISREEQDDFALRSQVNYRCAKEKQRFVEEMIPVSVAVKKGAPLEVKEDEHPRPEVTREQLASLRPAFRADGTVTAGNSSGLNDGAAALLLMERGMAEDRGIRPLARWVSSAVSGVHPHVMGLGPIEATRKLLQRTGLRMQDIALIEINEAFSAQTLACIRELEMDLEKVNVNGGAIAIGHPLGASGARILTTLIYELQRRGGGYGLATMCIGVGQGIATLVYVDEK